MKLKKSGEKNIKNGTNFLLPNFFIYIGGRKYKYKKAEIKDNKNVKPYSPVLWTFSPPINTNNDHGEDSICSHRLMVRTLLFHSSNTGSSPVGNNR